jgi:hypothetical protein
VRTMGLRRCRRPRGRQVGGRSKHVDDGSVLYVGFKLQFSCRGGKTRELTSKNLGASSLGCVRGALVSRVPAVERMIALGTHVSKGVAWLDGLEALLR